MTADTNGAFGPARRHDDTTTRRHDGTTPNRLTQRLEGEDDEH
jgi:hypothetical protein